MQILMGQGRSLLEAIVAVIGRSPISFAKPPADLPERFTEVDVAVLEWIAAEGRRLGRGYAHH
jgi:hypothetical protein